jgi:Holliday junction resolvase RusA-like endonuclease
MRIQKPDREPDIEFRVLGSAASAGSKDVGVVYRAGPGGSKIPVTDANGRVRTFVKDQSGQAGRDWRSAVAVAGSNARDGNELLDGPLLIEATIIRQRGPGHYGRGRNSSRILPSAPPYPAVMPDLDKLTRAVFDALTGSTWRDDSRVVKMDIEKVYAEPGEPEGAEVRIWVLPARVGVTARTPADQLALSA